MDMVPTIKERLADLAREESVQILYACESGSRAWGFASRDSDFDVRFIYVRHPEWYLSIDDDQRDVIERPIDDALDLSGWDLRKALRLFRKSNPPMLEWLHSPIVYHEQGSLAGQLRALLPEFFSPRSCWHHYLHMAQGNNREYLQGEIVRVKKYFYVLRPLLACRWIEQTQQVVPMEFTTLLNRTVDLPALRVAIDTLLARKQAGQELDREPRIPVISDFITQELERLTTLTPVAENQLGFTSQLNALFRQLLIEAWGVSPSASHHFAPSAPFCG